MRKIFLTLLFSAFGASCFAQGIANSPQNPTAYTQNTDEPKYKISETDMKILVRQLNNIEQCIFPSLGNPGYQKIYDSWSTAENMTMFYFQQNLLRDLIGEQNALMIETDPASEKYFVQMHEKHNNQNANVDKERCEEFKPTYAQIKQRIEVSIPQVYK